MKQLTFILIGVLAVLVAGCGFKSTESPLNNELVIYTAQGANDGEILLGVKDKNGDVFVEPGNYTEITADETVIFCAMPDYKVLIYGLNGMNYGTFDSFVKQERNGSTYYLGTADETLSYYFPGKDFISSNASYPTAECVFIFVDNQWEAYAYNGDKLWTLPEGAMLINSQKDAVVAVPDKAPQKGCKIYDVRGKEVKKMTASKWKRFKKLLINPQTVGTLQIYQMPALEMVQLLHPLTRTLTKEEIHKAMHPGHVNVYYA